MIEYEQLKHIVEHAKKDPEFFKQYIIEELYALKECMTICRPKVLWLEKMAWKIIGGVSTLNVIVLVIMIYEKLYGR